MPIFIGLQFRTEMSADIYWFTVTDVEMVMMVLVSLSSTTSMMLSS